jgi:hypothetical protein
MPVTTCDCERGFSKLKLLKTSTRNTLSTNLDAALRLYIDEHYLTDEVFVLAETIWKNAKDRRMRQESSSTHATSTSTITMTATTTTSTKKRGRDVSTSEQEIPSDVMIVDSDFDCDSDTDRKTNRLTTNYYYSTHIDHPNNVNINQK